MYSVNYGKGHGGGSGHGHGHGGHRKGHIHRHKPEPPHKQHSAHGGSGHKKHADATVVVKDSIKNTNIQNTDVVNVNVNERQASSQRTWCMYNNNFVLAEHGYSGCLDTACCVQELNMNSVDAATLSETCKCSPIGLKHGCLYGMNEDDPVCL
jgi:hypothetical protein